MDHGGASSGQGHLAYASRHATTSPLYDFSRRVLMSVVQPTSSASHHANASY
jgi:hypothetical protein